MTTEPHKDPLSRVPDLRVLEELDGIIADRLANPKEYSYVTSLVSDSKGIDKVLEKVGEEATEFIIAVKNGTRTRTVEEAADLQFHLMVALRLAGADLSDLLEELKRRRK